MPFTPNPPPPPPEGGFGGKPEIGFPPNRGGGGGVEIHPVALNVVESGIIIGLRGVELPKENYDTSIRILKNLAN